MLSKSRWRRAGDQFDAAFGEALDQLGLLKSFLNFHVQLGDNFLRCSGWCQQEVERDVLIARVTRLVQGRDVGEQGRALQAGNGQGPQLAAFYMHARGADLIEHQLGLATDDINNGLRIALVKNIQQLDAGAT